MEKVAVSKVTLTARTTSLQPVHSANGGNSRPSGSASNKNTATDNEMVSKINKLFPENTLVHSHYHCSTPCTFLQPQPKEKRNFKHAWLSDSSLAYDPVTGIWWLLYVQGQGMFCMICKQHNTSNEQNKQKL